VDLFDTLTFVEILVQTTFLGTLSLTVPKNLSQSDLMDCKIITIEGGNFIFGEEPELLSMF
jgi:hypothetical protein